MNVVAKLAKQRRRLPLVPKILHHEIQDGIVRGVVWVETPSCFHAGSGGMKGKEVPNFGRIVDRGPPADRVVPDPNHSVLTGGRGCVVRGPGSGARGAVGLVSSAQPAERRPAPLTGENDVASRPLIFAPIGGRAPIPVCSGRRSGGTRRGWPSVLWGPHTGRGAHNTSVCGPDT